MTHVRFIWTLTITVAINALVIGGGPGIGRPALAQEPAVYLSALHDFPLMEGMTEQQENRVIFDKPGGRIVEAVFDGPITPGEINDFYLDALPPLGWQIESQSTEALSFLREAERLKLTITLLGGLTRVHLTLEPTR